MAAEGSHDGAWNDWRWKTPDHWSSSSSSIPRAGWTWHGWKRHPPWSNQGWLPWNSPVDTTSKDPRQYGGERSEVIPSLDEVVAWLEAGLLDPSEGETEEPSHVGRWRQQKGPHEPQAAFEKEAEEERIGEYKPQKDAMPTAIPRAGALQGVVPLHQRQPGAYSAQGVVALEANVVSDDELETARKRWP